MIQQSRSHGILFNRFVLPISLNTHKNKILQFGIISLRDHLVDSHVVENCSKGGKFRLKKFASFTGQGTADIGYNNTVILQ